jgi:hypothetical protein
MSIGVGEFGRNVRRTMRAPTNPLDKSTIVSVYPREIHETKCTLEPGVFDIPAAPDKGFSLLVVGVSSWWKDVDPDQPLLEITVSSVMVANSVIRDYANGLFMCDMGESMPGLFYVPGEHDKASISLKFAPQLEVARKRQRTWYERLIKAGDVLWARSQGNPLAISDDMRLAAQELQLRDKPWLADFTTLQMINCQFCGTLLRPGFPVCSQCSHVVDQAMYEKLGGATRKVS